MAAVDQPVAQQELTQTYLADLGFDRNPIQLFAHTGVSFTLQEKELRHSPTHVSHPSCL